MHGLHFLVANQGKQLSDVDKVDEACVEFLIGIDVPEGREPVAMVEVSVATHHLAIDTTNVCLKVFRKSGAFAEPVLSGEG